MSSTSLKTIWDKLSIYITIASLVFAIGSWVFTRGGDISKAQEKLKTVDDHETRLKALETWSLKDIEAHAALLKADTDLSRDITAVKNTNIEVLAALTELKVQLARVESDIRWLKDSKHP